ncbi:hypothetical protein [Waddlia chondrophila]|uniref:Uncharacterized protein n=1 Tax=Waddlia chondrophila (strain ATCC VR-1470 / WSU 86-1044) TaxID=716544 RepID=D6YT07_WADCW|nr:hypothetical protein [Waddlia chondrophila]ADI39202.1 hypothetical protein wcw_1864 [Waddlia chondrophila WSU 86-1044]
MSAELSNNPYYAKVYIWDTKVGNEDGEGTTVGHASIDLQGKNRGRYFSFRPRNSLLVNPLFLFFPVLGKSEPNLISDIEKEDKAPDHTYKLQLNQSQYDKMAKEIDRLTKQTKKGKLLYHLFPNITVLKPIQMLATEIAQKEITRCPFSGHLMGDERYKDFSELLKIKEGHCASTVHQIVSSAFQLPPTGPTPWKIHPTQLGSYIEHLTKE